MDVDDDTADDDLDVTSRAPVRGVNDYPDDLRGCVWWANRIWCFKDNNVYYSGWEEIKNGVQEECFPASNKHPYPEAVQGLAVCDAGLLVFMAGEVWKVTGDSLDTFSRKRLWKRKGVRNMNCLSGNGKTVAWLDVSNHVLITDGVAYQEVSVPIRDQISSIDHAQASVEFHDAGTFNWLCLHDGGNSKLYIYDIDTGKWMPPWTRSGTVLASGETGAGSWDLLCANDSNEICKLTPTVYSDEDGAAYTSQAILNLFPIVREPKVDDLGSVEHVMLETNTVLLSTVSIILDDDPEQGSWTAISANIKDPPYRTQGTYLKQKQYDVQGAPAQRASMKFTWAAAATKWILNTIDLCHKLYPPR
jgi:hypothetical protein